MKSHKIADQFALISLAAGIGIMLIGCSKANFSLAESEKSSKAANITSPCPAAGCDNQVPTPVIAAVPTPSECPDDRNSQWNTPMEFYPRVLDHEFQIAYVRTPNCSALGGAAKQACSRLVGNATDVEIHLSGSFKISRSGCGYVASGKSPCNNWSAPLRIIETYWVPAPSGQSNSAGARIEMGTLSSTEMSCTQRENDLQAVLFDTLQGLSALENQIKYQTSYLWMKGSNGTDVKSWRAP